MKTELYAKGTRYLADKGESVLVHDGSEIALRSEGPCQVSVPAARLAIAGPTVDVDAEVQRLGLVQRDLVAGAERALLARMTDDQLAAQKAAIDAEVAKRPGLAEAKA